MLTYNKSNAIVDLSINDKFNKCFKGDIKMKKLNKVVIILSKIAEVGYFVGAALSVVIACLAGTGLLDKIKYFTDADPNAAKEFKDLSSTGFSITAVNAAGDVIPGSYVIFFITTAICLAIMAMVFRNVYLIFKTSKGDTWFSKGETPFQPDNIRMVREIGIFFIAIPIIQLIMGIIARIVLSAEMVECSVEANTVMMGLVVLALSQFFAYGTELQKDVDGLV